MGKFKKSGKKEVPQVSTSSLPDIAFLLNMIIHLLTAIKKKITEQFYFQNNLYF